MTVVGSVADELLAVNGAAAYALVGGLAFGESALFVGFVLPGETAVLLGGVLAHQQRASLLVMAAVAVAGAILGDTVGYAVGRSVGHRVLELRFFRKRGRAVRRGLDEVREHGGRAVFLARFTAFFRAVMPGLAGVGRMPYRRFLAFNAAGGLIWAVGFTLLGFAAGASYARVESVAGAASAVLLLAVILVALGLLLRLRRRARDSSQDRVV
jgi:membrane protein DedA with SNARE-associated domain